MKLSNNPFIQVAADIRKYAMSPSHVYVAPADSAAIAPIAGAATAPNRLMLNVSPAPYIGLRAVPKVSNPDEIDHFADIKVAILSLNPGYTTDWHNGFLTMPHNLQVAYANAEADELEMKSQGLGDFIFHPSHPGGPADDFWYKRLSKYVLPEKIKRTTPKPTEIDILNEIALVEYFPYRSAKTPKLRRIPTQDWIKEIIEKLMKQNVMLVITRSYRLWVNLVPSIATYPNVVVNSNPRTISISPLNSRVNPNAQGVGSTLGFDDIINAL